MRERGFAIRSKVALTVDSKLSIMGYAKREGDAHRIVISEWALDSEMLGGLILHELAHIYFTEMNAHSHDAELLDRVLDSFKEKEGLRAKETELLIDSYNHLQNILVDDAVFAVMDERELEMAKRFFGEWVSEKPSGDPIVDAALMTRNAFAVASLRRRNLYERSGEIHSRNGEFLSAMGEQSREEFEWLEGFLENSRQDWDRERLRSELEGYFERVLGVMRSSSRLVDLR